MTKPHDFVVVALFLSFLALPSTSVGAQERVSATTFTVTPAAGGRQLVRTSVPLPRGFLNPGQEVFVTAQGTAPTRVGLRVVSWYSAAASETRSARRALLTFPWMFSGNQPVAFTVSTTASTAEAATSEIPVSVAIDGEAIRLNWPNRDSIRLTLLAPARSTSDAPRVEIVEENRHFRWQRFHFADPQWPRVIETRLDSAGTIVVVAHLQRAGANGNFAPRIGWEFSGAGKDVRLEFDGQRGVPPGEPQKHSFGTGTPATCVWDSALTVYHPAAPHKRRGGIELSATGKDRWTYRYLRCVDEDRVPMQPMSWQRAEIVFAPPGIAPLTSSLASPHAATFAADAWSAIYPQLRVLPKLAPELQALVDYHRDAIVRSAAIGDDFGNVTSFADTAPHGGSFGMNRLNHGAAIFEDAWRGHNRPLLETALNWTDNFHDQSIWWGNPERGGTRYNNVSAQRQTPPTQEYMWRSDNSVSFCTKGYDCFWLAWEETGDPRFREAFEAQIGYASQHLHAYATTCRNVGDVRDFVRLYQFTGEKKYLEEALRLFRELRTRLSDQKLFDEGGKPLDPDPPFIEDDARGAKIGYAKPYIIGYALAGLPELIAYAPDEPDLKATVRAVADFLSETVDPAGGWRYPHPRSSYIIVSQGMEHAWQLTQAARALGPEPKWLDAIEAVLRSRILPWQKTGQILGGIEGWEVSTGKVASRGEINDLYGKPSDRDASRDYKEGKLQYGGSPPEGLVYFSEVLGYYLEHRPVERLLAPPRPDEPLGIILERSKPSRP